MFVSRTINADHKDLIHDVAFDFYGKRMATCSSDQSVKIWDQAEDGQWTCTANWKCHSGSVWKVSWGHPEFGPLIATCSFDRSVSVWEEIVGDLNSFEKGQSHWVKRGNLVDSRTSVNDVRFGPRHLGMLLACCSSDGIVRIFEASDVLMLSQWSLISEFNCKMSCSCLDWSQSKMHPPMIAVGSDDNNPNNGGKVMIFECVDNNKKWMRVETIMSIVEPVHDIAFAPTLGRSYHMLAVASKDVSVVLLRPTEEPSSSSSQGYTKFEIREIGKFDDHNATIWRVSWNITGTIFASSGDDGCIRLWKANYLDKWRCIAVIRGESGSLLADVSFVANTMGNSIKH